MTQRETDRIKRTGTLIAIDHITGFQEWLGDTGTMIYSLNADGNPERATCFCPVSDFRAHLQHLERVIGKRWETLPGMQIIRPELIPQY